MPSMVNHAALALSGALLFTGCGQTTGPTGNEACTRTYKVGLVTDIGKLDDKGFNANAWQGVKDAVADTSLCVEGHVIESDAMGEYEKNIQTLVDSGNDMVLTVGFLLTDATLARAIANPGAKFANVDVNFNNPPTNLVGMTFREDQAGFIAGALSGLLTQSNTVAGVYGLDVPAVVRFRKGFENGVLHSNPAAHVLGVYQDPGPKVFNDPEWGDARATEFIMQGADIVFAAGGNTGTGALLAAAREQKMCVGVDVDQFISFPDARSCLITSAQKEIATAVKDVVGDAVHGPWPGGTAVEYNAKNGGVGIAPYHDFDSKISAEIKAKVDDVRKQLADGTLQTGVP